MSVAESLFLDGTGKSPGTARRWVRDVLTALGHPQLTETAELGLTELVTNSCLHARTAVTVTVRVTAAGHVRFEVSDGSPVLPKHRPVEAGAMTGRGIRLVAACGDWGVQADAMAAGKTVWFEPREDMSSVGFLTEAWANDLGGLV